MTWKTHIIGGAQIGLAAAYISGSSFEESVILVSSAMLGSVLPDIDQPNSKLAKGDSFVGFISHIISRFTKHRGFTHTIPGAVIFALLFYGLAMFRTEKESIISFFLALISFLLIHAAGGIFSRLAGWCSVVTYLFGPEIIQLLTENSVKLSFNETSARLCALGVFGGCIMHMIYDTANKGGVPWLWPLSKQSFRVLSVRTNSLSEAGFAGVQILILSIIIAICYRDMSIMKNAEIVTDHIRDFITKGRIH